MIKNPLNKIIASFSKKEKISIISQDKNEKLSEFINFQEVEKVYKELNSLIGLDNIKELVKEIKAFVIIDQKRKEKNLFTEPLVFHMIFSGSPGTGKTTVARILGKLFSSLHILDSGHIIEVERADLVGEFVGQTAQKVKSKVEEALGGILFIDEAYSLARGGKKDFGKEAIDTLVKAMEDHKNDFILILAGYKEEMEYFLMSNPGLKSRFPIYLEFRDYSIEQLMQIAEIIAQKRQYQITLEGKRALYNILLRNQLTNDNRNYGNAREVRNIIEKAIRKQALRLSNHHYLSKEDLIYLKADDFKRL
ncbi:AAA family ATPase [Garciella nitratireducens]|uniref:Stage V sporulation protein K n=1 Tax=Garciella nitratireducens DSM 15102 TaxID=1121911 RepID=A0A1T4JVU6_9FIRM|nr:AAA family ATPase [Garciella nitratireducens]SJZ34175.1 stage V sporulation protein K [Garciella nitratireducens DSM 15102]